MKATVTEDGKLCLEEIPLYLADLFTQITRCEELGSSRAEERLYPDPAPDAGDKTISDDWKAHVQPGMHDLFSSARSIVDADLKRMRPREGAFAIQIPPSHAEPWLNALNQARLAIAAHHDLTEEDMNREEIPAIESARDLAIFRVHFYGFLQHLLLTQTGDA